jgi:hydroxyacylglutathione hydrolase
MSSAGQGETAQPQEHRMILRQFLHTDPVAISYPFGCGGHAACAVVDPLGNIEPYLRAADETGMRIRFVVDTHIHADHPSAGPALASAAAAEYVLHAGSEVGFSFHAAKDGDRLPLGNVVVDVLHTPGHTPEHLCLLVTDRTRADEPWFVLTSHTLMMGDVGRTELAEDAASGARTLFGSLQRVKALPDHIEVFRIGAEAEFVDFMLQDIPSAPVGAVEIRAWNTGIRAAAAE